MKKKSPTLTIKLKEMPNNCTECPIYQMNYYEDNESMFGDGIHHYCPYGGSSYGCAVERPKDCPLDTVITLLSREQQLDSDLAKTTFKYKVKDDLFREWFDDKDISFKEAVEIINNPKSYYDLLDVAEVCGYKPGWAYYEAKKLKLVNDWNVAREFEDEDDVWDGELKSEYYASLNGG